MKKRKTLIVGVSVGIVVLLIIGAGVWKNTQKAKIAEQQAAQENRPGVEIRQANTDDGEADEQEILSLLPKEVLLYKVQRNGFNQDESLYSVNAYISLDAEKRLKEAGFSNADFQKYAGCWIVDLRNSKAYRIAAVEGQDYNFYQWVGNDRIELLGDGKKTATTYDVFTGKAISSRKFNLDTNLDVTNWKTYQSDEYGFEVKYPGKLTVKEDRKDFVEGVTNRYVSFSDPDTGAKIYLGVKRKSEENIIARPFRTGFPGGEFFSRGTVAFGSGFARELWLMGCDFPGENRCAVELMQFCDTGGDFEGGQCSNIVLGDKEVFMEVDLAEKSDVTVVSELMHGMVRTFNVL